EHHGRALRGARRRAEPLLRGGRRVRDLSRVDDDVQVGARPRARRAGTRGRRRVPDRRQAARGPLRAATPLRRSRAHLVGLPRGRREEHRRRVALRGRRSRADALLLQRVLRRRRLRPRLGQARARRAGRALVAAGARHARRRL
ncbi:MAG: hypothetical protein AVDCRST_MAG65-1462, partial [uncultured Solirubrobacteraceae bacterium]